MGANADHKKAHVPSMTERGLVWESVKKLGINALKRVESFCAVFFLSARNI